MDDSVKRQLHIGVGMNVSDSNQGLETYYKISPNSTTEVKSLQKVWLILKRASKKSLKNKVFLVSKLNQRIRVFHHLQRTLKMNMMLTLLLQ